MPEEPFRFFRPSRPASMTLRSDAVQSLSAAFVGLLCRDLFVVLAVCISAFSVQSLAFSIALPFALLDRLFALVRERSRTFAIIRALLYPLPQDAHFRQSLFRLWLWFRLSLELSGPPPEHSCARHAEVCQEGGPGRIQHPCFFETERLVENLCGPDSQYDPANFTSSLYVISVIFVVKTCASRCNNLS